MSIIEQDIRSIPTILRQTSARIDERGDTVSPQLNGPIIFLGCGSSYCVAMALAALYEQERQAPGQAIIASERHVYAHFACGSCKEDASLWLM